jgi:UDP-N-acetylglucosamine 2-epimerase
MFGLGRRYAFRRQVTGLTAGQPALQIQAPTNKSIILLRAYIGQETSETSLQTAIRLVRKSAAATVTAAVIGTDVVPLDLNDAASTVQVGTAATGYAASTTGTSATGGVIHQESFNQVGSGWLWLPVPEERIVVGAGAILALEPTETNATNLFNCGIVFVEI